MSTLWVPSPNYWPGRPWGPPVAIVLHTMAGSIEGCDSWFARTDSQVSAHYGVSLQGDIHAYVRTSDRAWGNGVLEPGNVWGRIAAGNPNHLTVSIETEDEGDAPVTEPQYRSVRTLVRTMLARYGAGLFLLGHNQLAPRSRAHCPGPRWYDSGRFAQLVAETDLLTIE